MSGIVKSLSEKAQSQTVLDALLLSAGFTGFEVRMNAKKYVGITKASKATATRDLQKLLELSVFKVEGRSTRYELNLT